MSSPLSFDPGRVPQERVTLDGTVEIKQPPSGGKQKDNWDKFAAFAPLISGVVVAIVAYLLTDSVNTALKREELQLSNVTEMRALLLSLQGPKEEEWRAAAAALSAFGVAAVPPLVASLTTADEIRTTLIETSLRGIGMSYPKAVCTPMIAVLDNRTARFTWLMHKSAIRLIGDLGCEGAGSVVLRYSAVVEQARASGDLAAYQVLVEADPPVTPIALTLIEEDLKRTLPIVQSN